MNEMMKACGGWGGQGNPRSRSVVRWDAQARAIVGAILDFPELRGDPDVQAILPMVSGDYGSVIAHASALRADADLRCVPRSLAEFVAERLGSRAFDAADTAKAVLLENAVLLRNQLLDHENQLAAESVRRSQTVGDDSETIAALRAVTERARAKHGLGVAADFVPTVSVAALAPPPVAKAAARIPSAGGEELPLFALCESPAERAFLEGALRPTGTRHVRVTRRFDARSGKDEAAVTLIHPDGREIDLAMQRPVGSYRLDFVLSGAGSRRVAVEVDGFEYHERTQEQAERDRARDRALLAKGVVTVRFMAKAVFADAVKCADEAFEIALAECLRAA